ncbi:MAG: hypothetical protein HC848_06280 [Limnobacter sp.]|nr:hypothetical protein [Limnobacter sp.]
MNVAASSSSVLANYNFLDSAKDRSFNDSDEVKEIPMRAGVDESGIKSEPEGKNVGIFEKDGETYYYGGFAHTPKGGTLENHGFYMSQEDYDTARAELIDQGYDPDSIPETPTIGTMELFYENGLITIDDQTGEATLVDDGGAGFDEQASKVAYDEKTNGSRHHTRDGTESGPGVASTGDEDTTARDSMDEKPPGTDTVEEDSHTATAPHDDEDMAGQHPAGGQESAGIEGPSAQTDTTTTTGDDPALEQLRKDVPPDQTVERVKGGSDSHLYVSMNAEGKITNFYKEDGEGGYKKVSFSELSRKDVGAVKDFGKNHPISNLTVAVDDETNIATATYTPTDGGQAVHMQYAADGAATKTDGTGESTTVEQTERSQVTASTGAGPGMAANSASATTELTPAQQLGQEALTNSTDAQKQALVDRYGPTENLTFEVIDPVETDAAKPPVVVVRDKATNKIVGLHTMATGRPGSDSIGGIGGPIADNGDGTLTDSDYSIRPEETRLSFQTYKVIADLDPNDNISAIVTPDGHSVLTVEVGDTSQSYHWWTGEDGTPKYGSTADGSDGLNGETANDVKNRVYTATYTKADGTPGSTQYGYSQTEGIFAPISSSSNTYIPSTEELANAEWSITRERQ